MSATITTGKTVTYTNRRGEVLTGTVLDVLDTEAYGQPCAYVDLLDTDGTPLPTTPKKLADHVLVTD